MRIVALGFIFIWFFTGCTSAKITPKQSFEVYHTQKNASDTLFYLAKDDVKQHAPKTGFYPLAHSFDAFIAREELIRRAKHTLDLQYFIFAEDDVSNFFAQEILKAANRGVKVRILIDDLLLKYRDKRLASFAQHPNIELKLFNPTEYRNTLGWISMGLNLSKYGRRMHNKLFIADNSMAIIGGRNIQNIYFGADKDDIFVDDDMLAVGPLAAEATNLFETYWHFEKSKNIHDLYKGKLYSLEDIYKYNDKTYQHFIKSKYFKDLLSRPLYNHFQNHDIPLIYGDSHLFYDLPTKILNPAEDDTTHLNAHFANSYENVTKTIYVINPYFVPNEYIIQKIAQLRRNGIEIYILTNSLATNDAIPVYTEYSRYHQKLLELGVHLYELNPHALGYIFNKNTYFKNKHPKTSLHAKTMMIDGHYVIIGSANLDPRSSKINTEAVAVIDSEKLTDIKTQIFNYYIDQKNSYELSLRKAPPKKCIATCIPQHNEYEVVWTTYKDGKIIHYYGNDADAGFFRRLGANLLYYIPLGNNI